MVTQITPGVTTRPLPAHTAINVAQSRPPQLSAGATTSRWSTARNGACPTGWTAPTLLSTTALAGAYSRTGHAAPTPTAHCTRLIAVCGSTAVTGACRRIPYVYPCGAPPPHVGVRIDTAPVDCPCAGLVQQAAGLKHVCYTFNSCPGPVRQIPESLRV